MNSLRLAFASLLFPLLGLSGESGLQKTYQPLCGLGTGGIQIVEVTCVNWNAHSGQSSEIVLITARNVPPTNNEQAKSDLNIASCCNLSLQAGDIQTNPSVTIDATKFKLDENLGFTKEEILRATLECLRRVWPEKLQNVKVGLLANESDKAWISPILDAFNAADRSKPFFTPES